MQRKNKFVNYSFVLIIVMIFSIFSFAKVTHAATLNLVPSVGSYKTGDTIRVKVSVSSTSSINAVSGKISYPSDILSLTSISKAGSIVNLWAQEPSYSNNSGQASFEGVILSGYTGSSGTIITLTFKANLAGKANLKFASGSVLANDGNGSEVFSGGGISTIIITKGIVVPQNVDTTTPVTSQTPLEVKKNNIIKIEEIGNNDNKNNNIKRFLITPPVQVKDMEYMLAVDSMDVISWVDDGSHIFESPELSKGTHMIKITAKDLLGNDLNGFIEFSTEFISVPTITDYPTDLFVNNFLVLKGTADSLSNVNIIVTNTSTGEVIKSYVDANNSGKFSFVSEEKFKSGVYTAVAKAITKDGLESNFSNPVTIEVKENFFNNIMLKFNSYLTVITPVAALLVLLIFIVLYGIYHIRRFHKYLKSKLQGTKTIVSKSFGILEEDIDEEIAIFKKIRAGKSLDKDEQTFLNKFRKDIEAAEDVIQKEIKNIEKC
jgi:hypothetical protein